MYKNLLLLFFSTVISFGVLEIVLRVVMPERLAFVPTLNNNELTYVPNQYQRARHIEWNHDIHINEDGFRNNKTLSKTPPNTLLVLGDSFMEGYGVALDDSFSKQLEQQLVNKGTFAHAYNAGHYDTGLPTYRRVYHEIFRNQDNINRVIIGLFIGNDVLQSANPPDGRLRRGNEFAGGWTYKVKTFLGSHAAIYAVINYVVKTNAMFYDLCKSLGACYQPRPPNIYKQSIIDNAIPHTLRFVSEFVSEIRSDHREVLILIIPTREQIDDEWWGKVVHAYGQDADALRFTMNRRLGQGLIAAGIDVYDITDAAVAHARATGERLYFKYDGHWSPAGHRFSAEKTARHMLDTSAADRANTKR